MCPSGAGGRSVGVPQVLLRVLRHEVGGGVGLQVAGQARAAGVVSGGRARHSAHAAHCAAATDQHIHFTATHITTELQEGDKLT